MDQLVVEEQGTRGLYTTLSEPRDATGTRAELVLPGITARHVALAIKRATDVLFAALALVAIAPIAVLIALAIRIDSPGPVIFRQTRVGRRGGRFAMFKFRTMHKDAEAIRSELEPLNESSGIFKLARDPRVTRVGRLLRRASLDELPQFINVLRGEMSLVGPRPLIPEEDRLVEDPYRARSSVMPGITGAWQAIGPVRPPLKDMMVMDCLYAENWCLRRDLMIILRTVQQVIRMRGL